MTNKRKSVLIIGGGMQGSLVARDLIEDGYRVVIGDIVQRNEDIPFKTIDVTNGESLHPDFSGFDVVVSALPAALGEKVVCSAVTYGIDCVDLSFTEADLREYDKAAKQSNCAILADCGLAPGLPNLIIGYLVDQYTRLNSAIFYVGGIAQDPNRNYLGYVPSWSIPDLCSEYYRPARILVNGKVITFPPPLYHTTHDLELIDTPVGKLEAFYSDGVRSLLSLDKVVPTILEKTLRWPGHIKMIQKIAGVSGNKYYPDALELAYSSLERGTDDVVVLRVCGETESIREQFDLVCYGDENYTAMTRTTGHACAAFVELVLRGLTKTGVQFPEDTGMIFSESLGIVIKHLKKHGIYFSHTQYDKFNNCYL